MSNTISRYFKDENDNTFAEDSDLLALAVNSLIRDGSSQLYKKTDVNVFDKERETDVGSVTNPVYFSDGKPRECSLNIPQTLGVSGFSIGNITHGEQYIEVVLDVSSSTTSTGRPLNRHLVIRYGRISCGNTQGVAVVEWDTPMHSTDTVGNIYVQVTPTRGSSGGQRWGDDYFCLFTQNISENGFEIYSNHLGDAGDNGMVDYIVMQTYTTH